MHESSVLSAYLNEQVIVVTTDGGLYTGKLESYDHSYNIALTNTKKRIICSNEEENSFEQPLGLFIIRGDLVCTIGLVDTRIDAMYDWPEVRGRKIRRFR